MDPGGKLNIIVFTDTFFETNGVGSYHRTLLEWSRRSGDVTVTIVCPARDDLKIARIPDGVIPVRAMIQIKNPMYRELTLGYFRQTPLCKIVNGIPAPKIIHIATSGAVGVVGAMVAKRLNLPMVGCYHTDLQRYARLYGRSVLGRCGEWMGGLIAYWCDSVAYGSCGILAVASPTARQTVNGFYSGNTVLIPCPIDVSRFKPAATRDGAFRQRFAPDGKVLAAVIGRVAKEKNLDLICDRLCPDDRIQLVFVGDGPYAATLEKRWGVRVTGFLHGRDLLDAYQQSDLFVQLSQTETFGLSLIEALACGLPAVVLRAQGLVESLPPKSGVRVLESEELPDLADHCVDLVADKTRHEEYARSARHLAMQYGTDAILPRFAQIHHESFNARSATPRWTKRRLTRPGSAAAQSRVAGGPCPLDMGETMICAQSHAHAS